MLSQCSILCAKKCHFTEALLLGHKKYRTRFRSTHVKIRLPHNYVLLVTQKREFKGDENKITLFQKVAKHTNERSSLLPTF